MVFGLALNRQMTLTKAQYWLEAVLFPFPRHSWRWGWQFFIFWRGWNQEDTFRIIFSFFFFFLFFFFLKITILKNLPREAGDRSSSQWSCSIPSSSVSTLSDSFAQQSSPVTKSEKEVLLWQKNKLREKFPSLFQGFQGFATVFRAAILQTWPPQIIASSSAPLVFFYT